MSEKLTEAEAHCEYRVVILPQVKTQYERRGKRPPNYTERMRAWRDWLGFLLEEGHINSTAYRTWKPPPETVAETGS